MRYLVLSICLLAQSACSLKLKEKEVNTQVGDGLSLTGFKFAADGTGFVALDRELEDTADFQNFISTFKEDQVLSEPFDFDLPDNLGLYGPISYLRTGPGGRASLIWSSSIFNNDVDNPYANGNFAQSYSPETGWMKTVKLDFPIARFSPIQGGYKPDGGLVFLWSGDGFTDPEDLGIWTSEIGVDRQVTPKTQLVSDNARELSLASDGNGRVAAVWTLEEMYFSEYTGTQWSDPSIVPIGTANTSRIPQLNIHSSGAMMLIWEERPEIWAKYRTSSGQWLPETRLMEFSESYTLDFVQFQFDPEGNGFMLMEAFLDPSAPTQFTSHFTQASGFSPLVNLGKQSFKSFSVVSVPDRVVGIRSTFDSLEDLFYGDYLSGQTTNERSTRGHWLLNFAQVHPATRKVYLIKQQYEGQPLEIEVLD